MPVAGDRNALNLSCESRQIGREKLRIDPHTKEVGEISGRGSHIWRCMPADNLLRIE
jgi:hypothetical protein